MGDGVKNKEKNNVVSTKTHARGKTNTSRVPTERSSRRERRPERMNVRVIVTLRRMGPMAERAKYLTCDFGYVSALCRFANSKIEVYSRAAVA